MGQLDWAVTVSAVVGCLSFVLGIAFALLIARSILRPIHAMTRAMGELADGHLDIEVPALDHYDEIGDMAKAVRCSSRTPSTRSGWRRRRGGARSAGPGRGRRKGPRSGHRRRGVRGGQGGQRGRPGAAHRPDRQGRLPADLCEGVNSLVEITEVALKDVAWVLGAMAQGDLTRRITNELRRAVRPAEERRQRHRRQTARRRRQDQRRHRPDHHLLRRGGRRQPGPVPTLRAAGQRAGGNRGVDGGTGRDRAPERRQRPAGQPTGGRGAATSRPRAARWWPTRWRPWAASRRPARRSATSSA